jgi:hypothetical protein
MKKESVTHEYRPVDISKLRSEHKQEALIFSYDVDSGLYVNPKYSHLLES